VGGVLESTARWADEPSTGNPFQVHQMRPAPHRPETPHVSERWFHAMTCTVDPRHHGRPPAGRMDARKAFGMFQLCWPAGAPCSWPRAPRWSPEPSFMVRVLVGRLELLVRVPVLRCRLEFFVSCFELSWSTAALRRRSRARASSADLLLQTSVARHVAKVICTRPDPARHP